MCQTACKVLLITWAILWSPELAGQKILTVNGIDSIVHDAEVQLYGMTQRLPGAADYPRTTNNDGSLRIVGPGDWTSGFFPGALWYLYEFTGKNLWLNNAIDRTAGIESQKNNTGTHDLGFMLGCSFGNGNRLIDDPTYENILIQAATSLASRFDADVGCIRSWDFGTWEFPVIVDNMMNLELLFSATQLSGDSSYWKKAVSHADVTMLNHYRDDYSSYYVVDYNKTTGDTIAKYTHQGYSRESAWARGQSWGLYGYTLCYRFTKDIRYLEQAENIALFLIGHDHFPEDLVPYWDFDAPGIPNEPRDVAAATIMCSALFELSQYSEEYGETFLDIAMGQIASFVSDEYTAETDSNNNFLLMHGTGNYPSGGEIDKPLNYADYYYLEALTRYRRLINSNPQADFVFTKVDSITQLEIEFDAALALDTDDDELTYQWDFGDGMRKFTPTEKTSHIYADPGEYSVTLYLTDKWGGSDTLIQTIMVDPLVHLEEIGEQDIKVFPNPVSNGFNIELPDGYKGLIGRCFRNDLWANEQVSDALVINPMLDFSELVLNDPELSSIYGDVANEYVAFARKHVIEKWDKRGLWHEEGEYGDYIFGNDFIDPADPDKWVYDYSVAHSGMSQKFNIANKLGITNLRLYRITKDEFYRDKAEKLFYRMKTNFQYFDDHYAWHYWVPFYEGDILFEKK